MSQIKKLTALTASLFVAFTGHPAKAMAMGAVSLSELAGRCSAGVAPTTMEYLVHFESHAHPYAINVNGGYALPRQPVSLREAQATIGWLSRGGYNFDIGLAQVNVDNAASLGLTPLELLDPCKNLKAGSAVLMNCYDIAVRQGGEGQASLLHALSCYNTGSQTAGLTNGYVPRLLKLASDVRKKRIVLPVPALQAGNAEEDKDLSSGPTSIEPPAVKKHDGETDAFGDDGEGVPDAFVADRKAHSQDGAVAEGLNLHAAKESPNVESVLSPAKAANREIGKGEKPESNDSEGGR